MGCGTMLMQPTISRSSRLPRAVAVCCCALLAFIAISGARGQNPTDETSVEGNVYDVARQPITGATVTTLDPAGHPGRSVATDSGGRFSFKAPKGMPLKMRVSKDGFRTRELELEPIEAARQNVEIELERAAGTAVAGPEFSDTPSFAVAGVTDWSDAGLHGSNVNAATSESLAKDTAELRSKSEAKTSVPASSGERHRILGDAREKEGDPLGAVREYAEAARIEPSEENYFAWGVELLLHRAASAAIEVLAKGAAAFPRSERMIEALAAAYYETGRFADAAEAMCRASDVNPRDEAPYLFLGRMEQAATEILPCSKEKLARFAADFPANPRANFYRGLLSWKQARQSRDPREFEQAERFLRRASQLDPSMGEAYVQLGLLYNARDKQQEALQAFEAAVKAAPELGSAHYQLSLAYRRAGKRSDAERELRRYEELRKSEEALREKERKEMRQFITVLRQPTAQ